MADTFSFYEIDTETVNNFDIARSRDGRSLLYPHPRIMVRFACM